MSQSSIFIKTLWYLTPVRRYYPRKVKYSDNCTVKWCFQVFLQVNRISPKTNKRSLVVPVNQQPVDHKKHPENYSVHARNEITIIYRCLNPHRIYLGFLVVISHWKYVSLKWIYFAWRTHPPMAGVLSSLQNYHNFSLPQIFNIHTNKQIIKG